MHNPASVALREMTAHLDLDRDEDLLALVDLSMGRVGLAAWYEDCAGVWDELQIPSLAERLRTRAAQIIVEAS